MLVRHALLTAMFAWIPHFGVVRAPHEIGRPTWVQLSLSFSQNQCFPSSAFHKHGKWKQESSHEEADRLNQLCWLERDTAPQDMLGCTMSALTKESGIHPGSSGYATYTLGLKQVFGAGRFRNNDFPKSNVVTLPPTNMEPVVIFKGTGLSDHVPFTITGSRTSGSL